MSGIPSWARPGAKVVCVDASEPLFFRYHFDCPWPFKNGAVYVLTHVGVCPDCGAPECRISGAEALNEVHLDRFRPAVEDSDELGIETQLYRAKSRKSKSPVRESEPVE